MKKRKEYIVAGLPGVNTKIARRLLNHFKDVRSVFKADEDQLKQVEGLGKKKASNISSILDSDYHETVDSGD